MALAVQLALSAARPAGQPTGPSREAVSEGSVRAMARQAARQAHGDPTELVLALDRSVRERWGDFESFPLSIVRREELLVTVTAPYMAFRRSVVDVLRTQRTVDRATWIDTVVVAVAPMRLGAPDIESVVLTRNGAPVAPVRSALRPMTFANGTGEQGVLHAGEVHFAPAAFAPGRAVVLTLMPRGGDPVVYAFTEAELTTLR